ncbi:MAG: cysteine--tRNA ligase, partial [Muribaculaceae bacterium]|nr:cysteine--tRNA ligase [Muribaculaceae bacterium]
ALQGSEKALKRMLEGHHRLLELKPAETSTIADEVSALRAKCYEAMDDDLNTPIVIAHLFDACRLINQVNDHNATATQADIDELKELFRIFFFDIMGMRDDMVGGTDAGEEAMKPFKDAVDLLLEMRSDAKKNKDWATSDLIRDRLTAIGFQIKDTKDGFEWTLK